MVAVDEQPVVLGQVAERHVGGIVWAEGQELQRRGPLLEHGGIGVLRGIELVDDVDGLRRHAQTRHELVEGDDLPGLLVRAADEVPQLDAQEDLAVWAELAVELGRHRVEVGLLVERLPKLFA